MKNYLCSILFCGQELPQFLIFKAKNDDNAIKYVCRNYYYNDIRDEDDALAYMEGHEDILLVIVNMDTREFIVDNS